MNSIKHFIYIFCLYTILNLKKNVYFKENENSFRFFLLAIVCAIRFILLERHLPKTLMYFYVCLNKQQLSQSLMNCRL